MREEIRDIRRRINELEHGIKNLGEVTDSVTGTRKDGTFGSIRISGYPTPLFYKKKAAIDTLRTKLDCMELELLELTCKAEEYIESINRSELRIMFRMYYLDNMTWVQVAHRMNKMFPKRRIAYTEDNCWKRNERFFKNVG
ncbi:MAG: hypothetical protein RR369_05210 [Lachnospiraceae bacterium]